MTGRPGKERLVYGVGPVGELLRRRTGDIAVLYVSEQRKARTRDPVAELAREARSRGVNVEPRSRADLDVLAGVRQHQGAVAIAGDYVYADPDQLMASASAKNPEQPGLVLALDGVRDPHNLGAIVRSAYLFGADGIFVTKDRAAPITPVVTKVSAGATEHMAICRVTNLVRTLGQLKDAGFWICGLAPGPGARPLYQIDGRTSLSLVLGTEGTGIRKLVARTCDFRAAIPMSGPQVGSLNVSVAAGVALYEISRQRHGHVRPVKKNQ
ncbi:MAG: 23S rRNA (guanosine(2251)-2'-O)-methyltransferase RlmB [Proteobacteria bacterium]|nr:23S rRNA (guanosine(2251)-2'-O)-methyltransferase RlmB [Pseudomonadota bacterium]